MFICNICGRKIDDYQVICPFCGNNTDFYEESLKEILQLEYNYTEQQAENYIKEMKE